MQKYDLIVIGGFAGVGAAISASRLGARVLLVERSNCLGGAAGTAMTLVTRSSCSTRALDINALPKTLLDNGVFLGI